MKLYTQNNQYRLYNGNMLDMLEAIEPNTIDSIVTDPPYGLTSITKRFGKEGSSECQFGKDGSFQRLTKGFMGKEWDGSGIEYNPNTWENCYKVLKPGGYLLAFGGSRTFHRIACAIEDAGFEIRDTIMWLYGSGFPKSLNIGKMVDKKQGNERQKTGRILHHAQKGVAIAEERGEIGGGSFGVKHDEEETVGSSPWEGWGTALKPSYEPIIVARKPCEGSCVDNVLKWGVGGINIDECRVGTETILSHGSRKNVVSGDDRQGKALGYNAPHGPLNTTHEGRFPANTILTYDDTDFEEVCGGFPDTSSGSSMRYGCVRKKQPDNCYKLGFTQKEYNDGQNAPDSYGDSGSASRYFYCAKASKKDRDEGCVELEDTFNACSNQAIAEFKRGNNEFDNSAHNTFNKVYKGKNTHPTVKPTTLMQYLVRLVTPKGGTVLDPFNGSGSTGKAVMFENREREANYKYIGIELTEEYLPISKARIDYACNCDIEEEPVIEDDYGEIKLF